MSLYTVSGVVILDTTGQRLFAKYYKLQHGPSGPIEVPSLKDQQKLEENLLAKTNRVNSDIVMVDGRLVVYKQMADVILYLVAEGDENECLLYSALVGLRDSIDVLLNHAVDRSSVIEYYDRVSLAIDEVVDGGVILETDPQVINARVTKKASDEPSIQNVDLSEKGLKSMFDFAKGKFTQAVRNQFA